jgi:hypothetical protein
VAHSSGGDCGCHMGESSWLFKWPNQVGKMLGSILVHCVGYLSGPPKWLTFLV